MSLTQEQLAALVGVRRETIMRLEKARHHAALNGQELRLSPKEFEVLRLLFCASGKVLTKEAIYQAVWREPSNGCLHAVENTVFQLRRKLRPLAAGGLIETVAGYGYRLPADLCAEMD